MFENSYYYKRAMSRYDKYTDMSAKDKKFCASVEAATIKATGFAKDVAHYIIAAPLFAAVTIGCVGYVVVNDIKYEVVKSYNEYVKENGTRI